MYRYCKKHSPQNYSEFVRLINIDEYIKAFYSKKFTDQEKAEILFLAVEAFMVKGEVILYRYKNKDIENPSYTRNNEETSFKLILPTLATERLGFLLSFFRTKEKIDVKNVDPLLLDVISKKMNVSDSGYLFFDNSNYQVHQNSRYRFYDMNSYYFAEISSFLCTFENEEEKDLFARTLSK